MLRKVMWILLAVFSFFVVVSHLRLFLALPRLEQDALALAPGLVTFHMGVCQTLRKVTGLPIVVLIVALLGALLRVEYLRLELERRLKKLELDMANARSDGLAPAEKDEGQQGGVDTPV